MTLATLRKARQVSMDGGHFGTVELTPQTERQITQTKMTQLK